MTTMHEAVDRRREHYAPPPAESVRQNEAQAAGARPSDPPIYREMLALWAQRGRTLPGMRDAEWTRLAAPMVRAGQFGGTAASTGAMAGSSTTGVFSVPPTGVPGVSATRDPRGDAR
ncbi:hypothetical protein [Streptomyces triticagri]|uniref:hypothetical protein n=1 Tax=Streptomyces triticagri TaxID=2293568 RepID=UPI001F351652|nr:hypothetical protein [Streptomyces triticagri]